MKRLLNLLLCIVLLAAMAESVCAIDDGYDELREQIIAAMETGERLDISKYKLRREEMEAIYEELFQLGLLPWYADSFCDWTAGSDGTIAVISLRDLRKRSFSEDSYERAMAELIAETCHEGMTDLQKVLSVHDYIVSHVEYRYYDATNNGYHALVKGETQCYGYAQLFLRVMERVGIPCQIVACDDVGNGTGHAWNIVQIDGNWYHLDLTWEEDLPDVPGQAYHTYFLKTDKEFKWKYGHDFGWKTETDCRDKTYSNDNIWDDIRSPIIFVDSETMLLRRDDDLSSYIYLVDTQTGDETLLYSMIYDDIQLDGKYYYGYGTSLCYWNERVWFNTADTIYSMSLDGTDLKTEYIYDVAANNRYIFGFLVDDGVISLSLINMDYDVRELAVELTETQYHEHSYESSYVAATCETGSYTRKDCSCGITYRIDKTDPNGHELAGETISGTVRQYCLNCDYVQEEPVSATDPARPQPEEVPDENGMPNLLVPGLLLATTAVLTAGILFGRKKKNNI